MEIWKILMAMVISTGIMGCKQTDYLSIPTYNKQNQIQAVIEIPAGTNHKIEWVQEEKKFRINIRNGAERIIDFLPYPVNYGFIPSTMMDKGRGGDGDPLDVLVISEGIPSGSVLEIVPIGLLKFKR